MKPGLWKPETAPQAMVTKRNGNIGSPLTVNPLKAGRFMLDRATKIPITAPSIITISKKEFK